MEVLHLIIQGCCRVVQRLPEILFFEVRVFAKEFGPRVVGANNVQHPANCDPHATDAGLTTALIRLNRDAVERLHIFMLPNQNQAEVHHVGACGTCEDEVFQRLEEVVGIVVSQVDFGAEA